MRNVCDMVRNDCALVIKSRRKGDFLSYVWNFIKRIQVILCADFLLLQETCIHDFTPEKQ